MLFRSFLQWTPSSQLNLPRPFYKIKYPTGDWELPSLPLPNSKSRGLFQNLLPFQVYSCFNGITILDAALFHAPHSIRFRAEDGRDEQSECFLLCRDVWKTVSELGPWGKKKGRGAKIQVVPRVSVGYEVGEFDAVRKVRPRMIPLYSDTLS